MLPMKVIITLILSAFLLTSCSNPDTSGGVTLHKFGPRPADARDCWPQCPQEEPEPDEANNTKEPEPDPPTTTDEFPHGDCHRPHILGDKSQTTGCGYFWGKYWYVMPGQTVSSGGNLSGANLAGARLNSARLNGVNLSGANLSGAKLINANLNGANLSGANLSGAVLEGATLSFSNLKGANFRNATLLRADLTSSDLRGANFRGADLWYADTSDAKKDKSTVCADGRSWHYWAGGVASCGKPTASPW